MLVLPFAGVHVGASKRPSSAVNIQTLAEDSALPYSLFVHVQY